MKLLGCLLLLSLASCDDDISNTVSCTTDAQCLAKAGDLFVGDSGADTLPRCCSSVCILPAQGCATGARYLNSAPNYGLCVPAGMACAAPPDLAVPPDLSDSDAM